jgi:hypothetical protein
MLKRSPVICLVGATAVWLLGGGALSINAQSGCTVPAAPQAPTNLRIVSAIGSALERVLGFAVLSAQALPCLRTAANTGLAGAGISESSLTNQGSITYGSTFNGQTISGKRFTGVVTITGSNITLSGNLHTGSGSGMRAIVARGANLTIKDSTMRPSSGSIYTWVLVESGNLTLDSVDMAGAEDLISYYGGSNHVLRRSYLHGASNVSNPSGHRDAIEAYGGNGLLFEQNTIIHPSSETSAINIAPWSGSASISGLTVQDNYIDGGNMHFVYDLQSSGSISATRVKRNRMGGHTYPSFGPYIALNNVTNGIQVQTESQLTANPNNRILWPTGSTDPDRNIWFYTVNNPLGYPNISPNRDGQTVAFSN